MFCNGAAQNSCQLIFTTRFVGCIVCKYRLIRYVRFHVLLKVLLQFLQIVVDLVALAALNLLARNLHRLGGIQVLLGNLIVAGISYVKEFAQKLHVHLHKCVWSVFIFAVKRLQIPGKKLLYIFCVQLPRFLVLKNDIA